MKTSLTKRFSIRVKLRGKFVEMVIIDNRNGDIYYEQYDLEATVGEDISNVVEITDVVDASVPDESAEGGK